MIKLNRNWKSFKIKELFQTFYGNKGLQTPTGAYISKNLLVEANTPRITVRDTNNGIDSYSSSKNKNYRTFKNFISVSFLGSVFYHPYEASLDMKVHALIPLKVDLNEYIAKFLIVSIKNNVLHSSYGNQLSSTDLVRLELMLPINEKNEPDWKLMEDYIRQEQKKILKKVIKYYEQKNIRLLDFNKKLGINSIEWREYWIDDIIEIKSGVRLTKANQVSGERPFIGASDNNNGITNFVSNINKSLDKNVLGVNYNGSVVENFYHPYESIFSDDVKRIHFKNKSAQNKYCYLFLKQMILKQKIKYAYGYKFNAGRMKRQKILLPIDENGKSDYDFMEKYIRNIETNTIKKIIEYYSDKA